MLRFSGLLGIDTPVTNFLFCLVRYPRAGKLHADDDYYDVACMYLVNQCIMYLLNQSTML